MNLDAYLHSTQLMDCQGRVSHTLTVMPDGNVRIRVGARGASADPRHRPVPPPGVHRVATAGPWS